MSGSALKRLLSRAQMRLADRSDASRTEHMQQESGYVGGVPKRKTEDGCWRRSVPRRRWRCWQASLQNARELLEAAGARERARVGGSGRRVDGPRAWLAPGSPEEGTTPRPAKEERRALAGSELFSFETSSAMSPEVTFTSLRWPPPEPTVES